jgi:hypothetical protein
VLESIFSEVPPRCVSSAVTAIIDAVDLVARKLVAFVVPSIEVVFEVGNNDQNGLTVVFLSKILDSVCKISTTSTRE